MKIISVMKSQMAEKVLYYIWKCDIAIASLCSVKEISHLCHSSTPFMSWVPTRLEDTEALCRE